MGYRSEVTLALDIDAAKRLKDRNKEIENFLSDADTVISMSNPNSIIVYQWDWIKWYGNNIIDEIENFLHHNIDSKDYLLVIIGENIDDMSIEGTLNNNRIKVMRNVIIW